MRYPVQVHRHVGVEKAVFNIGLIWKDLPGVVMAAVWLQPFDGCTQGEDPAFEQVGS